MPLASIMECSADEVLHQPRWFHHSVWTSMSVWSCVQEPSTIILFHFRSECLSHFAILFYFHLPASCAFFFLNRWLMSARPQWAKHHGKCKKEPEFVLVLKEASTLSPGGRYENKQWGVNQEVCGECWEGMNFAGWGLQVGIQVWGRGREVFYF